MFLGKNTKRQGVVAHTVNPKRKKQVDLSKFDFSLACMESSKPPKSTW